MNSPIHNDLILYSDELKKVLDPRSDVHQKLIQKGLILYRQQRVYAVRFFPGKVSAKVQDVTPVEVELGLHDISSSRCSCPEEGICRHQAALFFSAFSRVKSAFSWIQEWKDSWQMNDILSTLKRGSDLLQPEASTSAQGYEQWLERIHNTYAHLPTNNLYQLVEAAGSGYRRLLGFAPVEREWKPLFQLFASMESLRVIGDIWAEWNHSEHQPVRLIRSFSQHMLEEAEDALEALTATAFPFAFDEYLAYLKKESATFLTEETDLKVELLDLYMRFWSHLFKYSNDREQELQRLENGPQDKRHSVAAIHLAILLEKDDLAIEKLRTQDEGIAVYALRWMKLLQAEKGKKRIGRYLPLFLRQITLFVHSLPPGYEQSHYTRAFLQTIDQETLMRVDPAMLERVYVQLLPHSRFEYQQFLLNKEDFKTWAELQVYHHNSIEYIDRHTVDMVAKQDPDALLPLYHQVIAEFINNRNRDSYKKAVRYMKRLQKLYKKEKKLAQWDLYLDGVIKRTKRLRAFQEECRKGKLIQDET